MTRIAQGTSVPAQNDTVRSVALAIDNYFVFPQQCAIESLRWISEIAYVINRLAKGCKDDPEDETEALRLFRIETLSGLVRHLVCEAEVVCEESIQAAENEHKPAILAAIRTGGHRSLSGQDGA